MTKKNNIFIVGAGDAALKLLREIKIHKLNYNVVAFIDDDKNKIGKEVKGIKILGPIENLDQLIKAQSVEELFIAIPSAQSPLIRKVLLIARKENIPVKIVPRTVDVLRGLVRFEQVREISPQDLLGRPVIKHDLTIASEKFKNKIVLVTGSAGSIGSELTKQIIIAKPKKIICFDLAETGMFYLENKLKQYNFKNIEYIMGSIQDKNKVEEVIKKYKPDVIFHAAAYKHVPLMEKNVVEAIKNNIFGTKNLIDIGIKYKVKDFVLVSTDKAINPSSVMGATKRVTEKMMYFYNKKNKITKFTAVRFGNVLSSNGSVVPLFEDQIKRGGPVVITHPEMVRYFMSIEEASQLIIQTWALGQKGEIFVLDMGEPIKIRDLAESLIKAYGFIPGQEIKIEFAGKRSGEKLFEEISLDKNKVDNTKHSKIFIVKQEEDFGYDDFYKTIMSLEKRILKGQIDNKEALKYLKKLVPNFKYK